MRPPPQQLPPQQQRRTPRSSGNAAAAAAASTAGAAAAATGCCGLPGATVTAAAAPPRPSSGWLNELRLQAGKSTLGSLNPLIDANAASFDDVTSGSSSGSGGFHGGWPATKGCDGVSGVGAPNCAKLATVVTAPPRLARNAQDGEKKIEQIPDHNPVTEVPLKTAKKSDLARLSSHSLVPITTRCCPCACSYRRALRQL